MIFHIQPFLSLFGFLLPHFRGFFALNHMFLIVLDIVQATLTALKLFASSNFVHLAEKCSTPLWVFHQIIDLIK